MNEEVLNKLKEYAEILKDETALKIVYYLYKYNPDVLIKEINAELQISEDDIKIRIEKLLKNGIIFRNPETDSYTMTPFGRNAFRELVHPQ